MPAVEQLGLGRLAVRRRRRVDDHRVDAAERGGQFGEGQRVDDRPAGGSATRRPRRRACHPPRRAGTGAAATSCCGMARETRVEDGIARHPDARARPRVPRPSRRGARPGGRGSSARAGRGTHRAGPSVAPVSICTRSTSAISSGEPATTPAMTSLWPPRNFVADSTTRSAPSSSGRQTYGDANVLSTTYVAPWRWARSARAA